MVTTAFMAKWFYAVVYNSMHVNICTIVPDFLKSWCDRKLMMNFKPGEYARIRTWYWSPFLRFDYFLKTTTTTKTSYEPIVSFQGNPFFIVIYLQDFLMEIFLLFREFVSDNIFPKDWMVMTMVQNRLDALISNGIFLYQLPISLRCTM